MSEPAGRIAERPAEPARSTPRSRAWIAPAAAIAAALAVAAASLALPWAITYDPWAWIVWGREIAHGALQTVDGPSWKPLPVLFTSAFSLAGGAAPALWLVTARTGGLLALAAAYSAGRRLAGPVAGVAAATALALDIPLARVVWLGDSEGLLVAAVLFAAERHLAGARRTAFALGIAAALLRPEVWPFLAIYGAWLWCNEARARPLIVVGGAALVLLWFVPELWGSGELWRSAARARQPTGGAAALARDPALEVVRRARVMLIGPVKAAAVFALLVAAARPREPRARAVLTLGAAAAAWVAMVAAMTAHGFSGNERYVIAPMAIACMLAGAGVAAGSGMVARLLRRRLALPLCVAILAAAAAGTIPYVAASAGALGRQAATLEYQASLRTGLAAAVDRFGGAAAVRRCGTAVTEDYSVPMLAWYLGEHIGQIGLDPAPRGVVFQARPTPGSPPDPRVGGGFRTAFRSGPVRVLARCRGTARA